MAYSIFNTFAADDVISLRGTEVTNALWSNDTSSLTAIYTSSQQFTISGEFYYDAYNQNPATSPATAEVQFSVAYGHISGGGSPTLASLNTSTLPTQVIYSQYKNLLLDQNTEKFSFNGTESDDIYVINIQRSRLRQAIDPGNWQLGLYGSTNSRTFIDDSNLNTAVTGNLVANNVYNIKSGSLTAGTSGTTVYGLVFPDYGVIILHPAAIKTAIGMYGDNGTTGLRSATAEPFSPYTGSAAGTNYQYQHEGLYRAISKAMANSSAFIARSAESITSTNYFVRLKNSQYNYSNNPTYYTGSLPQNILEPFRAKPLTYVTTIGLYNDANELLAVAKLSRPIQKSTDKEALIRVRLDY